MDRIVGKTATVLNSRRIGNCSINNILQSFWAHAFSVMNSGTTYMGEFCPKTRSEAHDCGFYSYALRKSGSLFLSTFIIGSLFYLLPIGQVYAEVPIGRIAYQGRLTDSNNTPLTGYYNFTFKIFDAASGGNQLWTETQNPISVDNGLLSVNLGDGTFVPGTIFNNASTYLEIKVNTNAPMTPRIHLLPSPYAFNSQTLQGYDFNAFVATFSAQTIGGNKTFTGPVNPAADLLIGGTGFKVIFSSNVLINGTGQDALKTTGGLTAGSGNVGIIDITGKIPAINSTYFSNLDGSALTNISATNIAPGSTNYIQNTGFLQSGAVFNVASGTVQGTLTSNGGFIGDGSGLFNLFFSSSVINTTSSTQTKSGGLNVMGSFGIGTTNPGAMLEVAGTAKIDSSILLGTLDSFGRGQIWNFMPSSVLRLGSSQGDGDSANVASEGIVVYGPNIAGDPMSSSDLSFARIKSNRFALRDLDSSAGTEYDYFHVDPTSIYSMNGSGQKTWELTRITGNMTTYGILTSSGGFAGDGAGLTGLNASNLVSGTVPSGRLSSFVALLNQPETFTFPITFGSSTTFDQPIAVSSLTISGSGADAIKVSGGLTAGSGNVPIIDITGRIPAITSTYFSSLDGSALTNISATNVSPGSTNYIQNTGSLQSGEVFYVSSGTTQGTLTSLGGFVGDGSMLFNLSTQSLADINFVNLSTADKAIALDVADSTNALNGKFSSVATDTTTLIVRIDNLDSSTATLTSRFANVAADTTTLKSRIDTLAVDTTTLRTRINNLDISTRSITEGNATSYINVNGGAQIRLGPITFVSSVTFSDGVSISSITFKGTVTSTSGFVGVGSSVTLLNASNLALGAVPNARLSVNVILDNSTATFTTPATFQSTVTFNQAVTVSSAVTVFGMITSTGTFQNKRVTSDRTTTVITAGDVTDMSFNIGANENWSFEINLQNGCSGTGGSQWAITFPAGGTLRAVVFGRAAGVGTNTSSVITVSGTLSSSAFNTSNSPSGWTMITGAIANGGTAGTVQLKFASVNNGQTSTVFANSYLAARRIN